MQTWTFFLMAGVVLLLGFRNLRKLARVEKQSKEERTLRLANGWIMTGLGILFIILGAIQLLINRGIL